MKDEDDSISLFGICFEIKQESIRKFSVVLGPAKNVLL
jgi:hypothetical protein